MVDLTLITKERQYVSVVRYVYLLGIIKMVF